MGVSVEALLVVVSPVVVASVVGAVVVSHGRVSFSS